MNILVLGGGGREHALVWAIAESPKCDRVYCAPGNPGIAALATCVPLDIEDGAAVAAWALANRIGLVVVGPEGPLAAGVADQLRAAGVLTVGPSAAAARLESSKAFTKEICAATGAPTAAWAHFDDAAAARQYLDRVGAPIVIKADGLAAGKGVTVAEDLETAQSALAAVFDGQHGRAEVVIEERMTGEEASLFVLCDGRDVLILGTAQDHKRAYDGDKGPNTGGMGAYSPAPILSPEVIDRAMTRIVHPTLAEMARRGSMFQGILYVNLMIDGGEPRLVEFNVRFGDPEAQVLMMRLGAQALDALLAAAEGRLAEVRLNWAPDHTLCVVLAAPGYPGAAKTGDVIGGLEAAAGDPLVRVFHAGTAAREGSILSVGGRVLGVTARGRDLAEAQRRAYAAVDRIDWPDAQYRRDIGWRALSR